MAEREREKREFGRRQSDLVLVELTEKIVDNNNSVSAAVSLMGENIVELSESQERIENKIDDVCEFCENLTENVSKNTTDLFDLKESAKILKQIDELKVLDLIKTVKRLIVAFIITAITSVVWFVIKDLILMYIKTKFN